MGHYRDVKAEGDLYPVVEIFNSVQFEGGRSGWPSWFIRLAGCNLNCPFCDTDLSCFTRLSVGDIMRRLLESAVACPNVVVTGGEPLVHNLRPLLTALRAHGFYIAMESNGSLLAEYHDSPEKRQDLGLVDWLTISPKTPILPQLLDCYAKELKYVVPDAKELIFWDHRWVYLQPEWNNKDALKRCLALLREHPRACLSVQTHKYLGLR